MGGCITELILTQLIYESFKIFNFYQPSRKNRLTSTINCHLLFWLLPNNCKVKVGENDGYIQALSLLFA